MIDEAGEDPVEIEPAPDVARDAAQGLGPMQEMRDLFLPTRDPDDGPDRIGEGRGQLRVGAAEPVPAIPAVRDHQQDAPGAVGAGDGHRKLAEGPGQDRRRHPLEARAEHGHGTGRRLVIGPGSRGRYRIERPPEDAEGSRQIQQTRRDLAGGHGRGSRRQAVATQLPEGDERQLGRGADLLRDPHQVVIEVAADDRQARDVVEQGEVAAVALRAEGVHAIGPGRVARDRRAGEMSTGVSRVRLIVMPAGGSAATGAVGRDAFRGREEPLEVSQAIAPIASGVDPVVAQATRVAPCSDRVRVDAQKPRGFGDRQGRVCGSGRQLRHHRGPVRTVKSTSGGYQPHSSCQ